MKMKQSTVKKVIIISVLVLSLMAPVILTGCSNPGTVNVEMKKA